LNVTIEKPADVFALTWEVIVPAVLEDVVPDPAFQHHATYVAPLLL
jgi:hypothetical protein